MEGERLLGPESLATPVDSDSFSSPYWLLLAGPIVFTAISFVQLSMVEHGTVLVRYFLPVGVMAGCFTAAAWILNHLLPHHDRILLSVVAMLCGVGLAQVARLAPPNFLTRQLAWLVLGTLAMGVVALGPRDLRWLRRYRYTWLIAGLALLATTLVLGVNPSGYGARLWLGAFGFYFQPSELLKLFLVVFLASYLEDRREVWVELRTRLGNLSLPHIAYIGPMLLMWGFSVLLLVWQRDLGAALLFFGVFLAMLYVASGRMAYVIAGLGLLVGVSVIGYHLFDHVSLRIDVWWNPWPEASDRAFQIVQSLLAFGAGGVLGQGMGQGMPTAIPVVHTDFVFAAIGEELGLLGSVGIVACVVVLVSRAFRIALVARRPFNQLLAAGIGAVLGIQSLVIMAGTMKLMPLTGVTLPFVSYGGSSLLTSMLMIGLLMNLSGRQRPSQRQP